MKKYLLFSLPILALVLVSAVLFYSVTRNVDVDPSFLFDGNGEQLDVDINGGESVTSNDLNVESQTSVNVPLEIDTVESPSNSEITHTVQYLLDNDGGVCPGDTCEQRIFISATDAGVSTLNDFDTMSWDVEVNSGYIAHVDVILETDALVFEYAKVDTPCDNAPYPTGTQDTFGDKGIVDSDAKAWLSSGVPGYCGLLEFDDNHKSLTEWKTERGTESVIGFELEVDNWVSTSDSTIKNIKINGGDVKVTLLPSDELNFNVKTEASVESEVWTGTVTTDVTANKDRL